MAQQQSPWLEGAYGWDFGEGGWNTGMDSNLLKFSFMFDRNIDSIVASLPAIVDGQAHYLTTDNRLYFAVGTTYFSTPVPKWFTVFVRSTGQTHQFDGTSLVQTDTPTQINSRLDAVELTVASLGTAAFEDIEFFATQADLDVAEAVAASYTDTLRSDIAADTGSALVGYNSGAALEVNQTLLNKASQDISVFDFMTDAQKADAQLDTPTLDHTSAIQAFFDALAIKAYPSASLRGNLRVTSKVTLLASKTLVINTACKIFSAFTAEDEIVLIKDSPSTHFVGSLVIQGSGSATYTTRTNGFGLKIDNSFRVKFDAVHVSYVKYDGVQIINGSDAGGGNSNLWGIGKLKLTSCGSGRAGSTSGVRKTLVTRVDTGSSNSFTQRSELTLDALPTGIREHDLVKIGSSVHAIESFDVGLTKIIVYPWLESGITSGDVDFYLGAGLYTRGGDSGVGLVNQLDAVDCGIAYNALSLYPSSVESLVAQSCSMAVRIGRAVAGAATGGVINHAYCEGNDFDVVRVTNVITLMGFRVLNSGTLSIAKCFALAPRSSGGVPLQPYSTLAGVQITTKEANFEPRPTLVSATRIISLDPKPGIMESLRANTATITISNNDDHDRVWNSSDAILFVAGSGTNNAPSGTITFTPPSGGTINGGAVNATVAFTSFSGPVFFYIRKETNNYVVQRCDQLSSLSGSTTYDPPSLADGAGASTTVTVTGAALGDMAIASFSLSTQGITVTANVTAADTVTVRFQNETGGVIDLTSGTLRARVIKV